MTSFVLRRLLGMVPTLACIVALSFALVRLAPGSPFASERALDPAVRAGLEARYGLDAPLPRQLGRYVWGLMQGDLGPSIRYPQETVAGMLARGLPHTLLLGALALAYGLTLGVGWAMGVMLAQLHGRPGLAGVGMALWTLVLSTPSFVLAPLLALALAVGLRLVPPAGWGEARHVVLPVLTLGTLLAASFARLAHGGLAEVARAEFIRTARAKGLPPGAILWRHMLRPGLMPLVTYLGPAVSGVLVGSVAIERIFAVPGIGPYFVDAALNRDYFVVMGIVLLESVLLLMCNLLADLALAWLDPRIRLGR